MKFLFMLGKYYPDPSMNGICTDNVLKELVKMGHDVTCLVNRHANEPAYRETDGIHVYRIQGEYMIDLKMRIDYSGKVQSALLKAWYRIFMVIRYPFARASYPLEDRFAVRRFYQKAAELYTKTGFDAVVAVHKPIETLYAAYKLKLRYPDVKLFPYMLDALSGGAVPRRISKQQAFIKRRSYEEPIFNAADSILLMGSSYRHYYELYKGTDVLKKMVFVDIPLFTFAAAEQPAEKESDGWTHIIYTGTLVTPVRDPRHFFEVLKHMKNGRFAVTVIGKCNCRELLMQYGSTNVKVETIDYVTHQELIRYFCQADLFVSFGVTFPCGVSGKIFEYMSYGKPIISTYSIDNEASLPYLEKYPLSFLLDERCTDIEAQAEALGVFIRQNANSRIRTDEIAEMFRQNNPRFTANEIVVHTRKEESR